MTVVQVVYLSKTYLWLNLNLFGLWSVFRLRIFKLNPVNGPRWWRIETLDLFNTPTVFRLRGKDIFYPTIVTEVSHRHSSFTVLRINLTEKHHCTSKVLHNEHKQTGSSSVYLNYRDTWDLNLSLVNYR